jgi:ABC-2 type transport system permease protein
MSLVSRIVRIVSVIGKDVLYSSRGTILIFAVLVPLIATLVISAVVDSSALGEPRLGLVDLGASELLERLAGRGHLTITRYDEIESLRDAVSRGDHEVGAVLPEGFDDALAANGEPTVRLFIWGESLQSQRELVITSIEREARGLAGQDLPVDVAITQPDRVEVPPWEDRLFPLVVIMVIIYGGMLIPATVLVKEKQSQTLMALTATPLSLTELLVAKGLTGMLLSIVMGVVILGINNAFGTQPLLLIGVIVLSALLAAEMGLVIGLFINDVVTLYAVIEGISILLYAPAIFYLFPQLPDWLARLFPTYYMLAPIIEMSLHDAVWADIASDVAVLGGLIVVVTILAVGVARHRGTRG